MKKVGIVTLHFYENFGSVLQAYALKHFIDSLDGFKAEIIPFCPELPEYQYFKEESLLLRFEEKRASFENFRKKWMELPLDQITRENLAKLDYDYYITGSDQIWNPEITCLHPVYFLDFVMDKPKIAYASSMALNSNHKAVNEEVFKKWIPTLDAISLREKTHLNFIQKFTEKKVQVVVDPTMLLEGADYLPLCVSPQLDTPYLFSYFLTHDATLVDYGNSIAKMLGVKLVHYYADYPGHLFANDDKCFAFSGPQEFLGYIRGAECIFTNSFHGTVFSILFEKPYYTYTGRRKMLSRVLDLTEILHMQDRRFSGIRDLSTVNIHIDYTEVNNRLEQNRRASQNFLKAALNSEL